MLISFYGKYIFLLFSFCIWRLSIIMIFFFNCLGCFWVFGGFFKDFGLVLLVSLYLDNYLIELNFLLIKVWKNN